MTRKDTTYPIDYFDKNDYLKKAWKSGWLDEYADNHFLIQAIEGKISDIQWEEQLLNNNSAKLYAPVQNGKVNYKSFSENFAVNLSLRLSLLEDTFGEKQIANFVCNQMAAGKDHYDRDKFFQALSEIEILSFYVRRHKWDNPKYEPPIGTRGENPEASLESEIESSKDGSTKKVRINIEVKTPKFPDVNSDSRRVIIPTVLLTDNGKSELEKVCEAGDYQLVWPRTLKMIQFINSAVSKFHEYSDNEINLLYVNWSYSDFPSNGFLEAWSILTNEINGLLTHPECEKKLNIKEHLSEDFKKKISAVIVYSSSLEQLMFSDFRFSWVRSEIAGPHFRMYVIDEKLRAAELEDSSNLLFHITGMNPDIPVDREWRLLVNNAWSESTDPADKYADCGLDRIALEIIDRNLLQAND